MKSDTRTVRIAPLNYESLGLINSIAAAGFLKPLSARRSTNVVRHRENFGKTIKGKTIDSYTLWLFFVFFMSFVVPIFCFFYKIKFIRY
jgi:hypothetical protein